MSDSNAEPLPYLEHHVVAELLDVAVFELYQADQAYQAEREAFEAAKERRRLADLKVAEIAPWSYEPLYLRYLVAPMEFVFIRIKGEPDEMGRDCEVMPFLTVDDLAELRCSQGVKPAPAEDTPI